MKMWPIVTHGDCPCYSKRTGCVKEGGPKGPVHANKVVGKECPLRDFPEQDGRGIEEKRNR